MAIFKCKMCGGTLEINNNESVFECEYCGTTQTLPKLDDDRKNNMYDRANHFRRNNEFDKAMGIYEQIFPNFQSITQDPLLDVICYILVVGVGLSILFPHNASSGGLDIVAKIMNKYLRMDMGRAMSLSGIVVALSSALCYDAKIVVLSVLGTYFGGIIVDHFIFDNNIKRRVCVISPQLDIIVEFVLHELHSGATLNEIIGAYDKTPRREMIAIVDKHEYRRLMDYVRQVDPKAFVTVYSVSEMRYQPKK